MNKLIKISVPVIVFVFLFAFLLDVKSVIQHNTIDGDISKLEIPENVQTILDKSCVMCHDSESKNTKGKLKLNFDSFTNGHYSTGKTAVKLKGIIKVMDKAKMPPKKFLVKHPEKALSAAERKLLGDWANEHSKSIVN